MADPAIGGAHGLAIIPWAEAEAWGLADSSADEAEAILVASQVGLERRRRRSLALQPGVARTLRGSTPWRRSNQFHDFDAGAERIMRDYMGFAGEPPVYNEVDFERRFRVPRSVFMTIFDSVKDLEVWKQTSNTTGKPQSHPSQKVVAAFRVFAYE